MIWRRLAASQERRAKELVDANIRGNISIAELASACRLSEAYFSRAFRETCGAPPHRWLLQRRVELAKQKLAATDMPLATIATDCGFVDQSHLQRVFARTTGVTPKIWRKLSA
jgi:AraC family transcriptional regulator